MSREDSDSVSEVSTGSKPNESLVQITLSSIEIMDFEFERMKIAELSCCILAFFGVVCAAISYDISFADNKDDLLIENGFLLSM
jgi:hypothetical protein